VPTVRQLEYLVAVADVRHFRRAAERVHTTQPTLSGQLKALEERLGVQLVERSRSRVVMTPIGAEIVEVARRVLRDVKDIRSLAASREDRFAGLIRLGLPPTIGPFLVPRLVPDLHREYPKLKLYVREEVPYTLPPGLNDGSHDVVIMPLPVRGSDFETMELFKEPLYLAMPKDHVLSRKDVIHRNDLRNAPILALGSGHQLTQQVQQLCDEVGARLQFDFEGTSLDTLREMVGTGLGLTFLPGLYVKTTLLRDKSIKTMPIAGLKPTRTIGMIWRKSAARRASFEELGRFFRTIIAREFPDL
jgi:LysR family hydrogen peroxide-inducible transcriptional activator